MGFGDWFRGLAWDKLSAALEFRRRRAVGKAGEGEGKGNGMGEHACGLLCLEACISLLQTEILGQVLRRVAVEQSLVLQVRPFRVMIPTDWSGTGQGSC